MSGSDLLPAPGADGPRALAPMDDATNVAGLLRLAVEKGLSPEGLEKLVLLSERVSDRAAARGLQDALRQFQEDVPPIQKLGTVEVENKARNGIEYSYDFAPLDVIRKHIAPHLKKNGLSIRFDSEEGKRDGWTRYVCIVSHTGGGEHRGGFEAPHCGSPTMGPAQKAGSASTYGQRYALVLALGLTVVDKDNDGQSSDTGRGEFEFITEQESMEVQTRFESACPPAAKKGFMDWLRVPSQKFTEIRKIDLAKVRAFLVSKEGGKPPSGK